MQGGQICSAVEWASQVLLYAAKHCIALFYLVPATPLLLTSVADLSVFCGDIIMTTGCEVLAICTTDACFLFFLSFPQVDNWVLTALSSLLLRC